MDIPLRGNNKVKKIIQFKYEVILYHILEYLEIRHYKYDDRNYKFYHSTYEDIL